MVTKSTATSFPLYFQSAERVLWDIFSSPQSANENFLLRYAAYVYYRSHGWIVRPSLSVGGVDFLLYADGPPWRHAAFAVIVVPAAECRRSAQEFSAHLRVATSVSKVTQTLSKTVSLHFKTPPLFLIPEQAP